MGQLCHFAGYANASGLYPVAHACHFRRVEVALYRAVHRVGRLHGVQLPAAQLGVREFKHRDFGHRHRGRKPLSS